MLNERGDGAARRWPVGGHSEHAARQSLARVLQVGGFAVTAGILTWVCICAHVQPALGRSQVRTSTAQARPMPRSARISADERQTQAVFSWDPKSQGSFVTCLLRDGVRLWVGTEDEGIWLYNADPHPAWKQFTTADGLGDNDIYALARDKTGRVWAGHLNHGVSVFNGNVWRNYGVPDGPIGNRVFAMACSPIDGDVWMGTDAGLTRYSAKDDRWSTYTRLDGLPSDEIQALAFGPTGTLFVGTQCDGIAIGSYVDDYRSWRIAPGPENMPAADAGPGLPSRMINCILAARHSNLVYVGTPWGFGMSRDGGKTWRFIRGANWKPMVEGLWHGPKPVGTLKPGKYLLEDYVTSLDELADGRLVIGFRQAGYEVWDADHSECLARGPADYVRATEATTGGQLLIASYGSGVQQAALPAAPMPAPESRPASGTDRRR